MTRTLFLPALPKLPKLPALPVLLILFMFLMHPATGSASDEYTNSIGMRFTLIPSGSFMMGSDAYHEYGSGNEGPRHRVTITRPFYIGTFEVTQAEWMSVMKGANPSISKGRGQPVETVSWNDTQTFISELNRTEGTGRYRLPSEAEWEYSGRAGAATKFFFGDDESELGQYAWYIDNSDMKIHPVGRKKPNPWGLYDTAGNVMEWTNDLYGADYYKSSPAADPEGPSAGAERVSRSCPRSGISVGCQSAYRHPFDPDLRSAEIGLRLAFTAGN